MVRAGSPAPAATSSTRLPGPICARSSMTSVAGPSQLFSVGPQRCQASAACCHCSRVVSLYWTGSKVVMACLLVRVCCPPASRADEGRRPVLVGEDDQELDRRVAKVGSL